MDKIVTKEALERVSQALNDKIGQVDQKVQNVTEPVDLSGINLYTSYPASSEGGKLMYNAMGKDIKCSIWEEPLKSMGVAIIGTPNFGQILSRLNNFAEEHNLSVIGYHWFWGLPDTAFVDTDGNLNEAIGVGLAETHIEGESGIYYALIAIG